MSVSEHLGDVDALTEPVSALDPAGDRSAVRVGRLDLVERDGTSLHADLLAAVREAERAMARAAELARLWDDRMVWIGDGSRSPAHRLARDANLSVAAARRLLAAGHTAHDCETVADAWRSGSISAEHVRLFGAARLGREAFFDRDEAMLVDNAVNLRFAETAKVVDYWKLHADAELDPDGPAPVCDPQLTLATTYDGVVSLNGCLDPIGGATVAEALRRIEREIRRADLEAGVVRSAGHRRAAALVELAVRANGAPIDGRRPEPLITIIAGAAEFERLCELSTGTVIHPGVMLPHLDRCDIQSIVFDSATNAVRASPQRNFTGVLRRVVQVRDRHCQHPSGCDEPIVACDVDHIVPRRVGGATDQHNGRLLCEPHNRHLQLRHPTGDPVGDFATTERVGDGGERSPPSPTG